MALDLTVFDYLMIVLLAACTALGVRRGVAGLVVGVAGLPLWWLLNLVGGLHPLVGFFLALLGGYMLGSVARSLNNTGVISAASDMARALMGGTGGLLLGLALVTALALSFQIKATPWNGAKSFDYPSADHVPRFISDSVRASRMVQLLSRPVSRGGLGAWTSPWMVKNLLVPDQNK